jgi:uncharacterized protein (TIGR02147 family)
MKSAETTTLLLESRTAPEFLAKYIEARKSARKSYGYAEIARASRIKSRSTVRDFIIGRRTLTQETSRKIILGLKLNQEQGRYFESLVALEKAKETKETDLVKDIERTLQLLKRRMLTHLKKVSHPNYREKPFQSLDWPYVYSSLIDENTGVTLEEICLKTRLSREKCRMILDQLIDIEIVRMHKEGKQVFYFPTSTLLSFEKLGGDAYFRSSFLQSATRLVKSAEKTFSKNEDRLFLDAIFSIESKELPALRAALQNRILETIQEFERPGGDELVTLVCGFFPNSTHPL